jgi:hypothetical protein
MTARAELPPTLAPWAQGLSALTPELAVMLGPLVRRLDDMISAHDPGTGEAGPLDGYEGLAWRGPPERLLASEWLLADELPLEFLRRAVSGELLYLAPAHRRDRGRGRVVVLVDAGPAQLGAARLVQLAALVVLHRRAAARQSELAVGVLGDEAGRWRTGELADLLRGWLTARRDREPEPEEVGRWTEPLDDADEAWLLTGPRLASLLPRRRRVLISQECAWGAEGVTAVRVVLAATRVELPLPRRDLAVRALRGASFLRAGPAVAGVRRTAGLRHPTFPSAERRLLARGDGDDQIVSVAVPAAAGAPAGRPRWHHFPGPVLAASSLGRRLVALVARDHQVCVHVVGKRLGLLEEIAVVIDELDLKVSDVEAILAGGLPPVFFQRGDLLCPLHGTWWRLPPTGPPRVASVVAAGPGRYLDMPRTAVRRRGRLWVDGAPGSLVIPADAAVVMGEGSGLAWSNDGTAWHVHTEDEPDVTVTVEPGFRVLGLVRAGQRPSLLTVSRTGRIVRLVTRDGIRTLTRWSGTSSPPALHPTLPLLAVQRSSDQIEVGDLGTGDLLLVLRNQS